MSFLLVVNHYKLAAVEILVEQCIVLAILKLEEKEQRVEDDQHCIASYFQFCLIVIDALYLIIT